MRSITFIFPHPAPGPTGGYQVVYEYANRFVADGYEVHLVYSGSIYWTKKSLWHKITNCVRYCEHLIKGFSGKRWFPLDNRIKEHLSLSMNYRHMPKTDVYVATSPYTADYLNYYSISHKRKFYFIQDKEAWGPGLRSILDRSYHFPLTKIVVSKWLGRMLIEDYKEKSILIPNGFDFTKFSLIIPPEKRDKYCISMLYHEMNRKRCNDTIAALEIVKLQFKNLNVMCFGVPDRPQKLPEWFKYYRMPDNQIHNWINNSSAIYVAASESEGWGLTVGEAMICGQAVCCTDNDGFKEMAVDGETALLSPVRNPHALAVNITRLIEDDELRVRLAYQGNQFIKRFQWTNSYAKFKSLLTR